MSMTRDNKLPQAPVVQATFKCPPSRRGVRLWEGKKEVFVCGWDLVRVGGVRRREVFVSSGSTVFNSKHRFWYLVL